MIDETLALLEMSQGHALILTTSNKGLKDIGEALTKRCPYPVKIQTPGGSNSKLVEWLKETPNGVLVGTSSFWEGVSVEGDALRLVIIDKIPFAPHTDPIHKAREAWYKSDERRKKLVFMELAMYPAVMKLKQGFGRLIRTKTDPGAVAILDPRLTGSRYGNTLLKSLPDATRATTRDDARLKEILR
jgi:ATP-dependent DNA helicase DinG